MEKKDEKIVTVQRQKKKQFETIEGMIKKTEGL